MLIKGIRKTSFIFILLFILNYIAKSNDILDDKYYFQLYPSENKEKPFLFHAYTPNSRLITINSTENENCTITENRTVNEYPIKNLSSVILFKGTLLIKTCFGPDKIVEIVDEKNETFSKKNNYSGGGLNNIKFCYSTTVYNPSNTFYKENIIITYWTEFEIKNEKEKYIHKCILFYPKTKQFSHETILKTNRFADILFNKNFYPQNCMTFRFRDIYCNIYLDSDDFIKSFFIDTSEIGTTDEIIYRVKVNRDYDINVYQIPISLEKTIKEDDDSFGDAFLTEYYNKKEKKIMLVSSLFFRTIQYSFLAVTDTFKKYYGINIEDTYISPYLFNHFIPNEEDFIAIYTMKQGSNIYLIMSRFNLTDSIKFASFREYSFSNYLREDICDNPKYIQSIFVNSFINYKDKDKQIMKKEGSNKYYKYQKDIVTLLACEKNNNVFYESKKIILPQCLNILDDINSKDKHIIKLTENNNNITLDIYNDPNLLSLRNITIEFLPNKIKDQSIILMVKKDNTNFIVIDNSKEESFFNLTHIRIKRNTEKIVHSLYIPYRLKQTSISGQTTTCHLASDICKFEIRINEDISSDTTVVVEESSYIIKESEVIISDTTKESDTTNPSHLIDIVVKNYTCFNNYSIWFELDIYKYYYAKINNCVYIFYNNSLFFYSSKKDCEFNKDDNFTFISNCLNNSDLRTKEGYDLFLKPAKVYNPNEETITIYNKNISNYYFHLIHNQKDKSISSVKIKDECKAKLKQIYNIGDDNLLLFKVDIKRNDTISRQIEYQFYNPDPQKIYEKLDLKYCYYSGKRRLEEFNMNEVLIYSPVDWTEIQKKYISELYNDNGIFLFNSTDDFYNNICHSYKTPNNNDIYLQERRNKYYINEPLCDDKCIVFDYEKESERIICKCSLKTKSEPKSTDNVIFTKKEFNQVFNKKVLAPNLRVIKCALEAFKNIKNNAGLFITFFLFLIFVLSYLYRCLFCKRKRYNKPFEDLRKQIKDQQDLMDEEHNNKNEPEEDEEEEILEHVYNPNKEKEKENDKLIEDEVNPPLIGDDEKPTLIEETNSKKNKRGIKNKKINNINTNKEIKKPRIIDSLSSDKRFISREEDENENENEDKDEKASDLSKLKIIQKIK